MSKSSGANDSSTNALKKLEAQGLAFSNLEFILAIDEGDVEKVALFIEAGIDVNEAREGNPPISYLVLSDHGNCEIAQLLIDKGADVNAMILGGKAPLILWATHKHGEELVQLLIDNGADVNAVSPDGESSIWTAVYEDRMELVRLLIDNGADINMPSLGGNSLMSYAVLQDRKELVQLLLDNGGKLNPESASGGAVSEKLEVTNIIERLELLEEKFGISISGLYASCYYRKHGTPPYHEVRINFDVASMNGGKLERSLKINASAYNSAGQLLDTSSTYINNEEFMGFGPMSILSLLDQKPERIRLFPAAYD